MPLPSEIELLISRLNLELEQIEEMTRLGLERLRPILEQFPNNNLLVQFYGYLNNALFLIDIYRKRVQVTLELLSQENISQAIVQDAGEELGDLLGRAIESKVGVEQIIDRLERLL